jgi:mannosyltransferase OCH1-like enzyme
MAIPRRLVRTVPAETTDEVERWWESACRLHPGWEHVTWRDPVDPEAFPHTSPLWDNCESGAQMADLIRAEDLYLRGGVYIDSDVEVYRPFDPLLTLDGFAGYDSPETIPNAIMGFAAWHPAITQVLQEAVRRNRMGFATWDCGVGVTTEVFQNRTDMLVLPPGSFYPIYWRLAHHQMVDWSRVAEENPWAFCAHHAHHSWKVLRA